MSCADFDDWDKLSPEEKLEKLYEKDPEEKWYQR